MCSDQYEFSTERAPILNPNLLSLSRLTENFSIRFNGKDCVLGELSRLTGVPIKRCLLYLYMRYLINTKVIELYKYLLFTVIGNI